MTPQDKVRVAILPGLRAAWTVAREAVLDSLSPYAARAKRRYVELPVEDMEALLAYMERLVEAR